MTTVLRLYPHYRNTNLDWLQAIPAKWAAPRLKTLLREVDERSINGKETLLSLRYERGLVPHDSVSEKAIGIEQLVGYKKVQAGEIVMNRMQAGNGIFAVASESGLVSPDYAVFRLLTTDRADFLVSVFKSPAYRAKFRSESKGLGTGTAGFLRLYSDRFGAIPIPLPPRPEQDQIMSFTVAFDRRVNRFIRAKRRLIELLNEQKQAIIHQAVTRGLDPDVPFQPSGVDWLGDIPAHWEETTVGKLAASLQTGPFGSQLHASDYKSGGIPVVNPSHMRNGRIVVDPDVAVDDETFRRLCQHKLVAGDIVLARRGELGRCALVLPEHEGFLCGTGSMRLRPKPNIFESAYLLLILSSNGIAASLRLSSVGSTMDNLNAGIVSRLRIPRPPLREQYILAGFVAQKSSACDRAIKRTNDEIDLMREYRTRLIADVVTGKLDVREAAAGLPEIGDEETVALLESDSLLGEDGDELGEDMDGAEEMTADAAD